MIYLRAYFFNSDKLLGIFISNTLKYFTTSANSSSVRNFTFSSFEIFLLKLNKSWGSVNLLFLTLTQVGLCHVASPETSL